MLINKEENFWKREVIKEMLGEEMVEPISNFPFSKRGLDDKLIWEATANGKFTVRSAYYLAVNRIRRNKESLQVVSQRSGCGGDFGI